MSGSSPGGVPAEVVERLRAARGFVFDMDGTLVLADRRVDGVAPLPGAVELTRWLTARGVPSIVVTNGTTKTPDHYLGLLRAAGLDAVTGVLTPATSAASVLRSRGHERAVVVGHEGLATPLRDAGIECLEPVGRPHAGAVVVGWAPDCTMDMIEAACWAVLGGARLYSASMLPFYATTDGRTLGTSCAICSAVIGVTGCDVEVVGKPAPHVLRDAATRMGVAVDQLAVVGDDPGSEIVMARDAGALAVGVDTGVADPDAFEEVTPAQRPDLHVQGVGDLIALLDGGRPPRRAPRGDHPER